MCSSPKILVDNSRHRKYECEKLLFNLAVSIFKKVFKVYDTIPVFPCFYASGNRKEIPVFFRLLEYTGPKINLLSIQVRIDIVSVLSQTGFSAKMGKRQDSHYHKRVMPSPLHLK